MALWQLMVEYAASPLGFHCVDVCCAAEHQIVHQPCRQTRQPKNAVSPDGRFLLHGGLAPSFPTTSPRVTTTTGRRSRYLEQARLLESRIDNFAKDLQAEALTRRAEEAGGLSVPASTFTAFSRQVSPACGSTRSSRRPSGSELEGAALLRQELDRRHAHYAEALEELRSQVQRVETALTSNDNQWGSDAGSQPASVFNTAENTPGLFNSLGQELTLPVAAAKHGSGRSGSPQSGQEGSSQDSDNQERLRQLSSQIRRLEAHVVAGKAPPGSADLSHGLLVSNRLPSPVVSNRLVYAKRPPSPLASKPTSAQCGQ
eukprot:TRINITY_DN73980_c0_g1_i1.p1 TRINITY_DN73980_c0_g1~~TRINITY_DN73980_c0_g1_i1.p1  ORF type:complete len:315 (-),score=45.24 TRINITY_DN73980_c0_g1_i1:102-1046(-)